jgi:hypothetical protein
MRKMFLLPLIIFVNLAFANNSNNQIPSFNNYKKALLASGIAMSLTNDNKLILLLNKNIIMSQINQLKQFNFLNPDISNLTYKLTPVTVSSLVGTAASGGAIEIIYQNPKVDTLEVEAYLKTFDNYGNPTKKFLFSYSLNRAIENKINWKNFNAEKMFYIAKNLKISHYYSSNVSSESQYLTQNNS